MGFSVSGSAAIVLVGLFIGFGILYGAVSNGFERVSDAQQDRSDAVVEDKNTAINITSAEYSGDRFTVLVNNTGASAIPLNETDFLVDNNYRTDWRADAKVNGDGSTWLWLPGERLNITIRTGNLPARAKVVTDTGVSDATGEVA